MRIRDRLFARAVLDSTQGAGPVEVSLVGEEAEYVAIALEHLGCTVVRSSALGKLLVSPPHRLAGI